MNAPQPLLAGRALAERYRIGARLHAGGTIDVYAAEDVERGGEVAVKVLSRLADDSSLRARIAREAYAGTVLRHPNVVRVLAHGEEEGGLLYIVMERLRGVTLRERIDAGPPLAEAHVRRIGREVLAGLDVAHAQHIWHRDLKPSNVFLADEDGAERVKVMDFGVARIAREVDPAGRLSTIASAQGTPVVGGVGTPRYFPPERIVAPVFEDHRGDLYAVGVLLYEALAARHPYECGSIEAQMQRTATHEAPDVRVARPDVSEALAAAVARALARDPAARYATAAEMAAVLVEGTPG